MSISKFANKNLPVLANDYMRSFWTLTGMQILNFLHIPVLIYDASPSYNLYTAGK